MKIDKIMFGVNHRYLKEAYGTFDKDKMQVRRSFDALFKKGKFGSVRYPGGTVANLFDWKASIGPVEDRLCQIHGLPYHDENVPEKALFGILEAASWLDYHDAEMIYVYSLATGSVDDAKALISFLNGRPNELMVNGIDWAQKRVDLGRSEPLGVRHIEIGNEMNQWMQEYWTVGSDNASLAHAYIFGGVMNFKSGPLENEDSYAYAQQLVDKEDWRNHSTYSDGTAHQIKYVRYTPVEAGSENLYVDDELWQSVADLKHYNDENVYTLDYESGKICFGDGKHGKVPPKGRKFRIEYLTKQEGFNDVYAAMKMVDPNLKIYASFEDEAFIDLMGATYPYDGLALHPYSGNDIAVEDEYFVDKILQRANEKAMEVEMLSQKMRRASKSDLKAAISEFGIFKYHEAFLQGPLHALYIASSLISFVAADVAYINKHVLVDFIEGDSLGPGKQAMILSHPKEEGLEFKETPSLLIYGLFNHFLDLSEGLDVETFIEDDIKIISSEKAQIIVNTSKQEQKIDMSPNRTVISFIMEDIDYYETIQYRNYNSLVTVSAYCVTLVF